MALPPKRRATRTAEGKAKTGAANAPRPKGASGTVHAPKPSGVKGEGSTPAPKSADKVRTVPASNRRQGMPVRAMTTQERAQVYGSPDVAVHGGVSVHRTPKAQHGLDPSDAGLSQRSPLGGRSVGDSPTGASNEAAHTQAHARPGQGTKLTLPNAKGQPSAKRATMPKRSDPNTDTGSTRDPANGVKRAGSRPRNKTWSA